MKPERKGATVQCLLAILCSLLLMPGDTLGYAPPQQAASTTSKAAPATPIPPEQLDSLVAPIALYPDPLLAQVLAASTYPLEIILLQRWLEKNKNLKDKELADAVSKQPWDASVQALAALPDVVKRLGDDIQWTTDLGNAFLAQESDVMDAVQRMRKKAQDKGTLQTTEQQKVETKVVEKKTVIVIEPANPQVVYVPSYNPVVVYGPAYYPYPPIYYPPWGYAATAAVSFGFGVMMGAFWSGGWGWGCGWGGNNVYINHNNNFNNFNRNTNINGGNRVSNLPSRGGGAGSGSLGNRASTLPSGGDRSNWTHNPQHRGGTPYRDRATADRFGGSARGDSLTQRRASAQQRIGRQGGSMAGNRAGSGLGGGAGVTNRASGSGLGNRGSGMSPGGADRIGSRDVSRSGAGDRSAFSGGSRGYNGSSARSSSTRGSSSFGGGGGFSRGGGGFSRGGGRRR